MSTKIVFLKPNKNYRIITCSDLFCVYRDDEYAPIFKVNFPKIIKKEGRVSFRGGEDDD